MASGSNAPFSGEFVDLENVPKLPEGISAEQIFENNSDVVRQVAEARHKAGLSQVNADGGFFDAFVNQNKIASLSNISINTSKNTGVLKSFTQTVDVSHGDNNFSSDEFFGLELESSKNVSEISGTVDSNTTGLSRVTVLDSSQSFVTETSAAAGQDFRIKLPNPISANTKFYVVGHNDGDSYQADNGDISSQNGATPFTVGTLSVTGAIRGDISNQSVSILFEPADTVHTFSSISVSSKAQTGTLTEKQFTFTDTQGNSFSPSKVGLFPDQNLNGQSITYDLKDSSGTVVKTFNQSDLNQLVDVSTSDSSFQVEANLSGNGTATPELEFLDVRGV